MLPQQDLRRAQEGNWCVMELMFADCLEWKASNADWGMWFVLTTLLLGIPVLTSVGSKVLDCAGGLDREA